MDASFVTAFIASVICSSDAIAGEQCCVVLAPARVDPQQLSMINQMQVPTLPREAGCPAPAALMTTSKPLRAS